MFHKTHIIDIYNDSKNTKKFHTLKSPYFKKSIKIFKKKDTFNINPNLRYIFKNCSVKEWLILSKKIERILKRDDYKIDPKKVVSTLILSFVMPDYEYLLSSYYHYSSKRIPKIKSKYFDISFLIKSLILNNDKDQEHLKLIKKKLHKTGISNFKFVFENNLKTISTQEQLLQENLSAQTSDILKHYLTVNKRKRNFNIYKIRKDFIYDAFLLYFINLNQYELDNVLFYKKNLNYFDYDYEIFVIKKKKQVPK